MEVARALVVVALLARIASAQPGYDPTSALRDANAAAVAGAWPTVAALTAPLVGASSIARTDRAEALRLHGLAAFFTGDAALAERDFVAYLHLEPDGHLDPALYPPEAINFFNDVRARHAAELRAARPPPARYAALTLVPPFAQFQNGERTKGWVLLGLLGAFAGANISTYFVLRAWCHDPGDTCDADGKNHVHAARALSYANTFTGLALIATYVYAVYDGVHGYRQRSHLYVAPDVVNGTTSLSFGVVGRF